MELLSLQAEEKGSMHDTISDNIDVFSLISLGTMQDFINCSFVLNDFHEIVYPLPPLHEKVFSASMFEKLKIIYAQLYPGSTINHFSQFYHQFRRLHYASEIIGSGKKSKHGIIMAFWPGHGNSLQNINTSRCQVGSVQYFFKHFICFSDSRERQWHYFCYVLWKYPHEFNQYFGQSVTVTSNYNEFEDACCFMPVQRIIYCCASGEMKATFGSITDTVFFACPISMRYCI